MTRLGAQKKSQCSWYTKQSRWCMAWKFCLSFRTSYAGNLSTPSWHAHVNAYDCFRNSHTSTIAACLCSETPISGAPASGRARCASGAAGRGWAAHLLQAAVGQLIHFETMFVTYYTEQAVHLQRAWLMTQKACCT